MPRRADDQRTDDGGREAELAHHLRTSVGELVRSTRTVDRMSPVSAGVMDLLRRHGPLTTAELASLRRVRHQSMAATVGELLAAGHVVATPHPADGRKKLITLTDAGHAELAADATRREAAIADAIATALSQDEREALRSGLAAIDRIIATLVATVGETGGRSVGGRR